MAFDPKQDAEALRKAMKGIGTDEAVLINILGRRTNNQLQQGRAAFQQIHNRDLIKDVDSETGGNFNKLCLGLLYEKSEYDAQLVRNAIKGLGTNEELLNEVLCTRTPEELRAAQAAYQHAFGKSMVDDVRDDTGGHLQKLYITLLTAPRNAAPTPDKIAADVEALYKAGEAKLGTNEDTFVQILGGNNRTYTDAVVLGYLNKYGHNMDAVIASEFSGHLNSALKWIVTPTPKRVAYKLHEAMAGAGTDDAVLIRLVASHKERHLKEIAAAYLKEYEKSLLAVVKTEASGDYLKLLIATIENFA